MDNQSKEKKDIECGSVPKKKPLTDKTSKKTEKVTSGTDDQTEAQEQMEGTTEESSKEDVQMEENTTPEDKQFEELPAESNGRGNEKEMESTTVQKETEQEGTKEDEATNLENDKVEILQDKQEITDLDANKETDGNSSNPTYNSTPKAKATYNKELRSPIPSLFQLLKQVKDKLEATKIDDGLNSTGKTATSSRVLKNTKWYVISERSQ